MPRVVRVFIIFQNIWRREGKRERVMRVKSMIRRKLPPGGEHGLGCEEKPEPGSLSLLPKNLLPKLSARNTKKRREAEQRNERKRDGG